MKVIELFEGRQINKLLQLLKKEFHDREIVIHFIHGGTAIQLSKSNEDELKRAQVVIQKSGLKVLSEFNPKTKKTTLFFKTSTNGTKES